MTGSRLVFEADAPYEATDEISLLAFNPGQVTPGGSISQSIATTPTTAPDGSWWVSRGRSLRASTTPPVPRGANPP